MNLPPKTRTGNLPWIEADDQTAFNAAEVDYGTDFDGDGNVGLPAPSQR